MTTLLDRAQSRLESHFADLAAGRKQEGHPVFALEHGLTSTEISEAAELLKAELKVSGPLFAHWLVWVIYAAEQGYNYDGEEYWHSFAVRMPYWDAKGSRPSIRAWFHRFHKVYFGARPQGSWADHFSIIAWPITHAILPRDLQGYLAQALFQARYRLASMHPITPTAVGRLIASLDHHTSSRFQYFLQQEDLVGRIVLSLLHQDSTTTSTILSGTLARIVSDLNKIRSARDWLHDARKIYSEPRLIASRAPRIPPRAGVLPGVQPEPAGIDTSQALTSVTPDFCVRRCGNGEWKVIVTFPSFVALADINPSLGNFLRRTRISIPCTGETPLPSGWLLTGLRQRTLIEWPESGESLIRLANPNDQLQELLNIDCVPPPSNIWLFHLGSDGVGNLVRNMTIRPGHSYLVVSRQTFPLSKLLTPCEINCSGAYGVMLDLPSQISEETASLLHKLNVEHVRSVRIEPIGRLPRNWDNDASGEWLTTEQPCFLISHDHSVESYRLSLDDGLPIVVVPDRDQDPIFVTLDHLDPGEHKLAIKASLVTNTQSEIGVDGCISLRVRTPTSWSSGSHHSSCMLVDVTPQDPTIEHFLENALGLDVVGPPGYSVRCSIELINASGSPICSDQIVEAPLPISADFWNQALQRFLSVERDDLPYLAARSGALILENPELGQFRLPLARTLMPTRWIYRRQHHTYRVILVDDTGSESIKTSFLAFQNPVVRSNLEVSAAIAGFEISAPGGLFTAEVDGKIESVILSAPVVRGGLQGLGLEINQPPLRACKSMKFLLELCALWGQSRLAGPLAEIRRNRVHAALQRQLMYLLCGKRWIELEERAFAGGLTPTSLTNLEAEVRGPSNFGIAVGRLRAHRLLKPVDLIEEYTGLAMRYGVCKDRAIVETACRVTSDSKRFMSWASASAEERLEVLGSYPSLVRGARLLTLEPPGSALDHD